MAKRDVEEELRSLSRLREASQIAVAAGCAGSAVTLVAPAREAEIHALTVLGRSSEADALRHRRPDPRAG